MVKRDPLLYPMYSQDSHTIGRGANHEILDILSFLSYTGSGFSLSPAALTWVAVDLSLALLVVIVLVIACFAWKSYSRKRIKERKVCSELTLYLRCVYIMMF